MFKKKKYTVIRQAISKDLASFIANYFCIQKQVYDTCQKEKYFSPFENIIGFYEKAQTLKCQILTLIMGVLLWILYYLSVNRVWKKQQV